MACKPNGEPFIDLLFFGTHYCSMYRWDDTEKWTILADKKRCRMMFASQTIALSETRRILMARKQIRAEKAADEPQADPLGRDAWKRDRDRAALKLRDDAFGTERPKHLFIGSGRMVEVVTLKRRAIRA